jgi:hypothetical protein
VTGVAKFFDVAAQETAFDSLEDREPISLALSLLGQPQMIRRSTCHLLVSASDGVGSGVSVINMDFIACPRKFLEVRGDSLSLGGL